MSLRYGLPYGLWMIIIFARPLRARQRVERSRVGFPHSEDTSPYSKRDCVKSSYSGLHPQNTTPCRMTGVTLHRVVSPDSPRARCQPPSPDPAPPSLPPSLSISASTSLPPLSLGGYMLFVSHTHSHRARVINHRFQVHRRQPRVLSVHTTSCRMTGVTLHNPCAWGARGRERKRCWCPHRARVVNHRVQVQCHRPRDIVQSRPLEAL